MTWHLLQQKTLCSRAYYSSLSVRFNMAYLGGWYLWASTIWSQIWWALIRAPSLIFDQAWLYWRGLLGLGRGIHSTLKMCKRTIHEPQCHKHRHTSLIIQWRYEMLTYLSEVQTRGQTLQSRARWQLRRRIPSWCCLCTSPPLTCTDRPHWPRLGTQRGKSANILLEFILHVVFRCTYILQSTPRVCNQRKSLSPEPCRHRSRTPRWGWPRYRKGTSGCFSPRETCLNSSTPSQSTHLNQRVDTNMLGMGAKKGHACNCDHKLILPKLVNSTKQKAYLSRSKR